MRSFKILLHLCFLWKITGNDLVAKAGSTTSTTSSTSTTSTTSIYSNITTSATSTTSAPSTTSAHSTTSAPSNEKTLTGVVIFLACVCAIFLIVLLGILVRKRRRNNKNSTTALGIALTRRSPSPQRQQNRHTMPSYGQSRGSVNFAFNKPAASAADVKVKSPEEEVKELLEQHQRHLKKDVKHLKIARDNIVNNLICYYASDDTLAECAIRVAWHGQKGKDFEGVAKDMLTMFWDRVLKEYFTGCEVFVPFLRTHKTPEADVFARFGSILSHTVAVTGAFPFPMAPSAILCMIYETYDVDKDIVVQDLFLFLNAEERSILKKANDDFQSLNSEERNRVQNIFFNKFDYGMNINSNNFKHHLETLAKEVICLKPRLLLERMRKGIPAAHLEHFWSLFDIDRIRILLQPLKPSPEFSVSGRRS